MEMLRVEPLVLFLLIVGAPRLLDALHIGAGPHRRGA
jgi:hypothetical protein